MRILINTPFITSPAGVSNHYLGLKPYFSNKVIYNQYYTRFYVRKLLNNKFMYYGVMPFAFVFNYLKFAFLLVYHKRPVVLLNPSFGKTALQRDTKYLGIAFFFGCKVAVFFMDGIKHIFKGFKEKRCDLALHGLLSMHFLF